MDCSTIVEYFRNEWKQTKFLRLLRLDAIRQQLPVRLRRKNSFIKRVTNVENNDDTRWFDNKNITLDFILENQQEPWDWNDVSNTYYATTKHYEQYPHIPWNKSCFNDSPDLTVKFILEHDELIWDFDRITINPNITMNDIENYPDFPWDLYEGVCGNPNLTIDFIINKCKTNPPCIYLFNWNKISKHFNITMYDIEQNPSFPWNYDKVCNNPNLTTDFVLKYHDTKNLDWNKIRKRGFSVEQNNYVDSNCSKLSLCFMLCGYEMNEHNALPFANLDYIFADNYLTKTIVQFL